MWTFMKENKSECGKCGLWMQGLFRLIPDKVLPWQFPRKASVALTSAESHTALCPWEQRRTCGGTVSSLSSVVCSDQWRAGEKRFFAMPSFSGAYLALVGAADKLEGFPVIRFLCLDGGSFSAVPNAIVCCGSRTFVSGPFLSTSDQSGCVCSSMKVNLQTTALFQFGPICINYSPLP